MTDSRVSTVEELIQRITARKQHLLAARRKHDESCSSLVQLLEKMQSRGSAFDDEDAARVREEIQRHRQQIEAINAKISAEDEQRREKEELFRAMFGAIAQRAQTLEEDDACLSGHPDMLKYFARKQLSLRRLLESKMHETVAAPYLDAEVGESQR